MGFGKGKGRSARDASPLNDGYPGRSAALAHAMGIEEADARAIRCVALALLAVHEAGGHALGGGATAFRTSAIAVDHALREHSEGPSVDAEVNCPHCGLRWPIHNVPAGAGGVDVSLVMQVREAVELILRRRLRERESLAEQAEDPNFSGPSRSAPY